MELRKKCFIEVRKEDTWIEISYILQSVMSVSAWMPMEINSGLQRYSSFLFFIWCINSSKISIIQIARCYYRMSVVRGCFNDRLMFIMLLVNIHLYKWWYANKLHELPHSHGLGFTLALHTVFSLPMVLHINPCGWLSNEGRFNTVYSKLVNLGNSLHGRRGWPAKDSEVFRSPTEVYSSTWSILPRATRRSERDPTYITTADQKEKWAECGSME